MEKKATTFDLYSVMQMAGRLRINNRRELVGAITSECPVNSVFTVHADHFRDTFPAQRVKLLPMGAMSFGCFALNTKGQEVPLTIEKGDSPTI